MNEATRPSGAGFWKEHSENWKTSGLTQIAYCAREGISYQSFVYQHNRLSCKSKPKPKTKSLGFIALQPETSAINSQVAGLQLILPNGIRIGIGGEITATLLQTVLSVAGGLKCCD